MILIVVSLIATHLSCGPARSDPPDPKDEAWMDVHVTVLVRDEDGNAIADAPIEGYSLIGGAFGFTDEQGVATIQVRCLDEDGYIWIGLSEGQELALDTSVSQQAKTKFEALTAEYAFPAWNSVPISSGQASATTEYRAEPAITIEGIITHSDGSMYQGAIGSLGSMAYSPLPGQPPEGRFYLSGVPRGRTAVLTIGGLGPQAHLIDLTQQQAADDLDLGVLPLVDAECNSDLELRFMNNIGMLDEPDPAAIGHEVCMVSADGSIVLTLQLDRRYGTANVFSESLDDEPGVMVPSGEYYVTPGRFGRRTALLLVRCVRQGLIQELEDAGVPKVEIIAGERTVVTIDARAAYDAVHEAAAALGP